MAKPLTSWLVPSFSQHNLRLVVSERCLHVSVTKFWDKFASLRQVNTPNSWDKFQNCCADMYLIRLLPNFAVFCVFLWISRIYLNFAVPRPRETSEALTRSLYYETISKAIWSSGRVTLSNYPVASSWWHPRSSHMYSVDACHSKLSKLYS